MINSLTRNVWKNKNSSDCVNKMMRKQKHQEPYITAMCRKVIKITDVQGRKVGHATADSVTGALALSTHSLPLPPSVLVGVAT